MSSLATTAKKPTKKKSAKGLLLQYLLFKSLGPTKHHFGHLHDHGRWDIYNRALASSTMTSHYNSDKKNLRVANVGAGWGMLTSLARTHMPNGTEFVTVERLRPVANAVREFLLWNVTEVEQKQKQKQKQEQEQEQEQDTLCTVISSMEDDDSFCDVILLDVMAPCLYESTNTGDLTSGLMATLRSLNQNSRATSAATSAAAPSTENHRTTRFLPRAARLWGCLVHIPAKPCVPALSFPLSNEVCGVHINAFNSFRQPPQGFDAVPMDSVEHSCLSAPFVIDALDFGAYVHQVGKDDATNSNFNSNTIFTRCVDGVKCTQSGLCNALLVWHDLDCGEDWSDPSLIISSEPNQGRCLRRQAVVLLDGIDVKPIQAGTILRIALERDEEIGHVRYFDCMLDKQKEKGQDQAIIPQVQGPRKLPSTVSRWHFSMLLDNDRNEKYQKAIAKAVSKLSPDDLVLDIGTGTGLLACFAAQANSNIKVVGCEANAPIARVAYTIVKRNGLQEKIRIVLRHSTDLVVGGGERDPMDRKASLLVSEILDCGLLGEQVLPVVKHARKHLLTENAVAIPARARVKGVLVDLTASGPIAMSRPTNSIGPPGQERDGSTFNKFLRWNTWEQIRLQDMPHVVLTEPFDMVNVDLRGYEETKQEKRTRLMGSNLQITCIAAGVVSAVVMWFDMDLDEEGEFMITTSPGNVKSCWSQSAQLLASENGDPPRIVEVGEEIEVECSYNDDRVKVELA
jgi:type II protein arginine methyltransferase